MLDGPLQVVLGEEGVLETPAAHGRHLEPSGRLRGGEEILVSVVRARVEQDLDDGDVAVGCGGAGVVGGDADGLGDLLAAIHVGDGDVLTGELVGVDPALVAEEHARISVAMRQELVAPLVRDPHDEGSELAVQAGGVVGDDVAVDRLGGGFGVRGGGEHERNPRCTGAVRPGAAPAIIPRRESAREGATTRGKGRREAHRRRGSARRGHHTDIQEPNLPGAGSAAW